MRVSLTVPEYILHNRREKCKQSKETIYSSLFSFQR